MKTALTYFIESLGLMIQAGKGFISLHPDDSVDYWYCMAAGYLDDALGDNLITSKTYESYYKALTDYYVKAKCEV